MDDSEGRLSVLLDAARGGGRVALDSFRTAIPVETKDGPLDPVTEADRAAQRRVAERIGESYPDDPVVGEEDDAEKRVPPEGSSWIVDPIDGTNNYVAGNRRWATSVAAVRDGEPVAAVNHLPALGDTYAADADGTTRNGESVSVSDRDAPEEFTVNAIFGMDPGSRGRLSRVTSTIVEAFGDLRHVGSGQSALSMVADGELDAVVSTVPLDPWDTVAGAHLVRRAGGTVTDVRGNRWRHDSTGIVASNGRAHDALVEAFGDGKSVRDA
ncbi:inositol monophosphatase family protein [Halegenticoccus tardaugens]|uniref:inositol monophosphatase family protein n=1 Tax=Halegenticoccus tardaugens TaxID=2071624 RepID=UPI00100A3F26|nr:inositol monophosphatase family protein [Halegenticoccus tardaugens]